MKTLKYCLDKQGQWINLLPRLLTILLAVFALGGMPALADGVYIPKIDPSSSARDLSEPTQKALIVHHKGVERLILQVSYRGSVSEFAWLIPTPAQPKLDKGAVGTFRNLHIATAPRIKYWLNLDEYIWSASQAFGGKSARIAEPPGVDVLERRVIGAYDTAVLRARSETDLLNWLRSNKYNVSDKARAVLADYIRRGWIFTAARINTAGDKDIAARLKEGTLEPLSLQFRSKQPVYPLKISSINSGRTKILIHVVADHLVANGKLNMICAFDNYTYQYGISAYRFAHDFAYTLSDEPVQWKRYCITKLAAEFEPRQMSSDLVFARAESQKVVEPPGVSPPFLENLGALVFAPFAFLTSFPIFVVPCLVCLIAGKRR